MRQEKKTAPLRQQESGGNGQQVSFEDYKSIPVDDSIIFFEPPQDSISRFMMYGSGNAINTRALSALSGLPARAVTMAVMEARRRGEPILSNADGYYLPSRMSELRECIERLRRRARQQLFTLSCLKRAYLKAMQERQEKAESGETGGP